MVNGNYLNSSYVYVFVLDIYLINTIFRMNISLSCCLEFLKTRQDVTLYVNIFFSSKLQYILLNYYKFIHIRVSFKRRI